MPNIKAENLIGKSYAKVTGEAINKEFVQGNDIPPRQRFASHSRIDFNLSNF